VTSRIGALAAALCLLLPAAAGARPDAGPPELETHAAQWPVHNQNLASTRASASSAITSANVRGLRAAWRFPFTSRPGYSGVHASTPLVLGDTVYVQDLNSNVFALARDTGTPRWERWHRAPNSGPNGLAVGYGKIFGATDATAFALHAATGRRLWSRRLASRTEQFVEIAPVVANGLVYLSTVGFAPGGRGALYALDEATGRIRWRFDTILEPWRYFEAGGGGAWYPLSVDADGRVYAGISNPGPWGGTRQRPNGGGYPGPALYTDSLLVLDGATGELLWYDQVTPHDVRDYDFQLSPILATLPVGGVETDAVFGGGKAGIVVAWNRETHERLWSAPVGRHKNDRGPLPRRQVEVCPGLFGGVLTPMAYAEGRLFVPVVNLCSRGGAYGYQPLALLEPETGTGELVALDGATGARLWRRTFPSPVFGCATVAGDVVFTSTYDGRIYGLAAADGRTLWTKRARAGINACPAVDGDMLLLGAGVAHPAFRRPVYELIAYALPS
jgi:outer membrane protein assembly factor BamB